MAICQAHKLPKTHLERVTGKGDRSKTGESLIIPGLKMGGQVTPQRLEMKRVALLVLCAVLCAWGETRQAVVRLTPSDTNSGDDRFIAFAGWDASVYRISPDSVVHPLSLDIHGK